MAATAVYCRLVACPLDARAAGDSFSCANVSTDQTFTLSTGGLYAISVIGTGFGTVALQQLGPDDSTYVAVTITTGTATVTAGTVPGAAASFAANGNGWAYLLPRPSGVRPAMSTFHKISKHDRERRLAERRRVKAGKKALRAAERMQSPTGRAEERFPSVWPDAPAEVDGVGRTLSRGLS